MSETDSKEFEDVASGRATIGRSAARLLGVLWRPDMARWRPYLVFALIITIAAKALAVVAPLFFGEGINRLARMESGGEAAVAAAGGFVLFFLAFAATRLLANGLPYGRDAMIAGVSQDAQRVVAVDAFGYAQHLPLQFHLTRRAGALQRIIERGASALDYLLRFLAFNIAPTLVELSLAAIVLWVQFGWRMSLAALVTVAGYAVFTITITEWRTRQRRVLNRADTELRGRTVDSLSNAETVKSFAAESRETQRYDEALRGYNSVYVRLMRSLAGLNIGQEVIMTGGLLAAALIAGYGVLDGRLEAGDAAAVVLILTNIYRPLNILGWAWREIRQGVVDMEKLFGLMEVSSDVADAPDARAIRFDGGAVRFEDVAFLHEGRARGLSGVSFEAPAGAFIGLAGPSGAGKSTILKLLFRFYDPAEGRIIVDGQDIRDVTQYSLRDGLGLVPQEVVLFNDTLRYNLSYGRPDADDAEILEAARRAQLGAFIESLPDGLDTRVGERGMKLSGGEKQRVGVARAILKDPAILVLDEATSSLDSETEREVQTALAEAAKGRTTIAVAHRLSTISAADLILVFDDGRIAEQGTHEQLLAANGVYAQMWARQSGAADARVEAAE